jgi:hypothetical protein
VEQLPGSHLEEKAQFNLFQDAPDLLDMSSTIDMLVHVICVIPVAAQPRETQVKETQELQLQQL